MTLAVAGYNESVGLDTNGEGLSIGVFFSGCSKEPKCDKCHNPSLWNLDESTRKPISMIIDQIKDMGSLFTHVVLLGGEPLDQPLDSLKILVTTLKQEGYRVWMYTGKQIEDVPVTLKSCIDVIVAGPYIPILNTGGFPGSSNQIVYKNPTGEI